MFRTQNSPPWGSPVFNIPPLSRDLNQLSLSKILSSQECQLGMVQRKFIMLPSARRNVNVKVKVKEKVESQILLSPKFRNKVDDMGEDICSWHCPGVTKGDGRKCRQHKNRQKRWKAQSHRQLPRASGIFRVYLLHTWSYNFCSICFTFRWKSRNIRYFCTYRCMWLTLWRNVLLKGLYNTLQMYIEFNICNYEHYFLFCWIYFFLKSRSYLQYCIIFIFIQYPYKFFH